MNAEPQTARTSPGQPGLLPKTRVRASALSAAVRTGASTDSTPAPCWANSLSWAETTPADEDGQNRRIGKKVSGVLVEGFFYGDEMERIEWINGTGAVNAQFVYGTRPNVPEYMMRSGTTYRLLMDQVGSVRLVVNASTGSIAQRIDYDEFGNVLNDSAPGFQPLGFAGGLRDADTGLTRFGARDEDANTGRWTAKDPLRFSAGDTDFYAYTGSEPINRIDPSGRAPKPFDWKIRDCAPTEDKMCRARCGAKGVKLCEVKQTFLPVRITDVNGNTLVTYVWKSGTPTCLCNDDDQPFCGPTCQKVLTWSAIAGGLVWVCATGTPSPIPAQ